MDAGGDLTNAGNITVRATGGTAASATQRADASATAGGIYAPVSGGTLSNSGDITVTAEGGRVTTDPDGDLDSVDAEARGIVLKYTTGTIVNSGNISVTATAGSQTDSSGNVLDTAYGIYISEDANLTNTGRITAASSTGNAYEVYIDSGTTTLVDTYNMTLDDDPARGSILVGQEAVLDLNNSALTASLVDSDIRWDTEYRIFDNYGTITGSFSGASLSVPNPNVTLTYVAQGTGDFSDDALKITYGGSTAVSPVDQSTGATLSILGLAGNILDRGMVQSFFTASLPPKASVLVADSGAVTGEAPSGYLPQSQDWNFFMTPMYADIHNDADPTGYAGRFSGAFFGMGRRMASAQYGFSLGFGRADLDYLGAGMAGNSEDQDIYTLGVHAMGQVNDWTWRLRVAGADAQSKYRGLTGLDLTMRETADYHAFGLSSTLAGGRLFRVGRHILMPEAGLEHSWLHRKGFTTAVETSAWNLSYDSLDEHQLFALGLVRWLTESGGSGITPSVAAGVKQRLTGNDLSVTGSIPGGSPFQVTSFQEDTLATLNVALRFDCMKNSAITLAYDGEYGKTSSLHNFWGKFSLDF